MLLFSFESFCTKVKKCSEEIFRYIVYGSWRGNTMHALGIAVLVYYLFSYFFLRNAILFIIFYLTILLTLTTYIVTRKMGFGMNKEKFIFVKFSHFFYKPKKVFIIPFENIKYLKITNILSARIITMSFLSEEGKIEKIKFSFNKIVIGLSVTEQRHNALEISKKLLEIEKKLDRGDF